MKDIFDLLFRKLGSQSAVAKALGYTCRQYLNIRRKVERGEELHPRVETFILVRAQMLERDSVAFLPNLLPTACTFAPASIERLTHGI
jgi:hypothetical protein